MKELIIDINQITFRRVARFRKEMAATTEILDPEEQAEKQCELMAGLTENWTADELLDLPLPDLRQVQSDIDKALKGQVPNANATS